MDYRKRRSIRLNGYNYCSSGIYFVTICTQGRENVFGRIENKKIVLNKFGIVARNEWIKTSHIRTYVELDAFIIMPNHVHGILVISHVDDHFDGIYLGRGMMHHTPTVPIHNMMIKRQFGKPIPNSLPTIIGAYKSSVTREINKLRSTSGQMIWQRNYFERIVRTRAELFAIRKYILNNPKSHQLND